MKADKTLLKFRSLHESLLKEKAQLEARLSDINSALGVSSGATATAAAAPARRMGRPAGSKNKAKAAAKPGRRASGGLSLRETVVSVLQSGGPLDRHEILAAVKKAGYQFTASDPLNSLSTLLYTNKKTFKKNGGKFSV